MIRKIIKLCLRNRGVTELLKKCYDEVRAETYTSAIPEAAPIQCRISAFQGQRLNLLVPALSIQHVFGGISTALDFFSHLSDGIENVRIVLTDQQDFTHGDNPAFENWKIGNLEDQDFSGRWIIPAGNRYGKTLSVGKNDRFVATAWWTAISAGAIQAWQLSAYHLTSPPKFVYLIQDFEPCFYPWSSRYALAESTYHQTDNIIAVFNTGVLKQFFDDEGYSFASYYTFEPKLNQCLLSARPKALTQTREQRVLVYGRPGVARNAFEVIVMGLRLWVSRHPVSAWSFVSAGEPHAPVDLSHGKKLIPLGKLSLEEYAMELGRCRIGISLMISPHPSYPPLEMAAFGMQVITNCYKSKNLSLLSSCIHSIKSVSPDEIASSIERLTKNPGSTKSDTFKIEQDLSICFLDNANFAGMRIPILKQIFS